jgi:xanthosine utilization system XapX-like protein
MKPYLLSLGAGLLVGVLYSLLGVRSPAPPAIALLWACWACCWANRRSRSPSA